MELQVTTTKHLEISAEDQSINHARMREKLGYYLGIFKKALYPNFAEYS